MRLWLALPWQVGTCCDALLQPLPRFLADPDGRKRWQTLSTARYVR